MLGSTAPAFLAALLEERRSTYRSEIILTLLVIMPMLIMTKMWTRTRTRMRTRTRTRTSSRMIAWAGAEL